MKRLLHVFLPTLAALALCLGSFWYTPNPAQAAPSQSANHHNPQRVVGYFTQWGIYSGYFVKNLVTSGSASKMTVLNYAFGNLNTNLQCFEVNQAGEGDAWADYQRPAGASDSVTGVADDPNQTLKGNFNQIRELKALYPNLKAMISIGGWTWSARFSDAALTPQSRSTFVKSCLNQYILGNLPQLAGDTSGGAGAAAGVFDGIDIDWEYPGSPGNVGNVFRPVDVQNYTLLMQEFRTQLDQLGKQTHKHYLLSVASPAGKNLYSKLQLGKVSRSLDFVNLMTYDYHGPWESQGPTNFNAPLYNSPNDPSPAPESIDSTVRAYLRAGVPSDKLVIGLPFYGHGWTNVPNQQHGLYQGNANTQPAPTAAEAGTNNYNVLQTLTGFTAYRDPITRSPWLFDGTTFWSYDDPLSIMTKMHYVREHDLGGAMIWSMDGDDANGSLITATYNGLHKGS